ncbi:hypothetical protein F383_35154 [Gossypium arboreum]|uniref:Uncharacterized protein n=1 Tax=Gossypium arboreum TaxID=29729 RepID=A0A0B0NAF2_GOSAR|nr:hypothetical protein F383_35154 [Gossypium arboreum]
MVHSFYPDFSCAILEVGFLLCLLCICTISFMDYAHLILQLRVVLWVQSVLLC